MQRAVEIARPAHVLPIAASQLRIVRGSHAILDRIDFKFQPSMGLTAILGPNGAGKSVFVRTLANLLTPDGGRLTWAGTTPDRDRMKRVGFVFQRPVLLQRSVAANITFALNITGTGGGHENDIVREALENAGLLHLSSRHARSLSGGEQQRVALARSIACSPELLILDEPTINLDPASMAAIEARLASARAAGTPILMITHDLAQARRLADTVVFMHRGRVCEIAAKDDFFASPRSREAEAFLRGEIVL